MSVDRTPEPKPAEKTHEASDASVLVPALARLGLSVGVFGATFFVIAIVLTMLFSPDRFPVRVGEKTVRLHELEAEEKRLIAEKADLLEERKKILADTDAPVLHQVQKLRALMPPVGSALLRIEEVRRSFAVGSHDPISLPQISFREQDAAVRISGEVRDVNNASMQILASFVDELRALPSIESVSEPEYTSEPLPEGGTLSRFSITLRLAHE